ncbi:AI-2E family transporter [Mangrovibacterium lignilyticum]|uniref:AI-2E family transporter n=1 Tax=Mangrovibacterium lignilyticum TaxID=2668052 RepID=UPI0013CF6A8C|nr:AI-2E family transporter [Mangrovibacterium lignilyticum]
MKNPNLTRFALILFCISVIITGLVVAKNIFIPLAISVFFSYLIYPIVVRVEKWGVHRGLSIFLVIILALAILGGAILLVSVRVSNLNLDLVQAKAQVDGKVDSLIMILERRLGINSQTLDEYFNRISENIFTSWENKLGTVFSATTTTLFQLFILPVYTFFMLFYRTKTAHFIIRLVGRKDRKKVIRIMREVSKITTSYMGGLLIVVLILAILNSVGLVIIGIPHAILFGIGAALLNLIPYIGTFIGGLLPILYVFFTQQDPFQTMLQIFILFWFVQFLENNLLTPGIVGSNIKINPFAIIFSLLLGNLIWGIAGMLIVVPFLAIMKVIMRNVDELKPFAYLISDRGVENHKIRFQKLRQLFKRKGKSDE